MASHYPSKKRQQPVRLFGAAAFLSFLVLGYQLVIQNNSPISSKNGSPVFDGALVEDILSEGEALLTIEHAHVNGEGKWPPHGPYGSIHVVVYSPEQRPEAPWQSECELYRTMLYGPHKTIGDLYEWLDDEALNYTNYALYDWNLHTFDQIVLRFYESDPGPGREHDELLAVVVSKQDTQAHTITLHSEAVEIRIRTQKLSASP